MCLPKTKELLNTALFGKHMSTTIKFSLSSFIKMSRHAFLVLFTVGFQFLALGQKPLTEDDFYSMVDIPTPPDAVIEGGGICFTPNGRLAISTRYGEIWLVYNPLTGQGEKPVFRRFATGMHEVLGLAYRNGSFYCAQRGEITKLTDTNGDGVADKYECFYKIPISGHYHEYAFGPIVHPVTGDFYVTLNVGFGAIDWWSAKSYAPWRGWMLKISEDGTKMEPFAAGLRSPCGVGFNKDFDVFYSDNQGDWMGSGFVMHVEKGDFTGNPAGLKWTEHPESPLKLAVADVEDSGLPLFETKKKIPALKLPSVWLPHGILGNSTSDILTDTTGNKFGPFANQLFVGDQGQSIISRVFLEKVKGVYQGASFMFRSGFASGVLRLAWAPDGSLFTGQTNRGWSSTGPQPFAIQRLVYSGVVPFEMKEISARPDGFEITFTKPVNKISAQNPASYAVNSFIYKYHAKYGSPVINMGRCPIKGIQVAENGLTVRLVLDSLRQYYIHEVKAAGVLSENESWPLLHDAGYYTLNEFPDGDKLNLASLPALPKPPMAPVVKPVSKPKTPSSPKAPTPPKPSALAVPANLKHVEKMPASWTRGPDKTMSIGTMPGLKFDQKTMEVAAGAKVRLIFNNYDDMQHNLVIVKPGTVSKIGEAANKLGINGNKLSYVPISDDVLFHTTILQPESAQTIYFEAPKQPGEYTIVCTMPGHWVSMQAVLRVR